MKLLLSLALPLFALDQATKWWAIHHIVFRHETVPVIENFFSLCYWDNTGMAWGLLKDNNLPFVFLSIAALIGLAVAFFRCAFPDTLSRCGVGLLVAGILGNVTDRIAHGHVVDLLLFDLHIPGANPFPAFNVADACICTAAGLFVLGSLRAEKAPETNSENSAKTQNSHSTSERDQP